MSRGFLSLTSIAGFLLGAAGCTIKYTQTRVMETVSTNRDRRSNCKVENEIMRCEISGACTSDSMAIVDGYLSLKDQAQYHCPQEWQETSRSQDAFTCRPNNTFEAVIEGICR